MRVDKEKLGTKENLEAIFLDNRRITLCCVLTIYTYPPLLRYRRERNASVTFVQSGTGQSTVRL